MAPADKEESRMRVHLLLGFRWGRIKLVLKIRL
jgi:hypothetical protein